MPAKNTTPKALFVKRIEPHHRKIIIKYNPDIVVCEDYHKPDRNDFFDMRQANLSDHHDLCSLYDTELVRRADLLIESLNTFLASASKILEIPTSSLKRYFHSRVLRDVRDDFRLIILAENLFGNHAHRYIFASPRISPLFTIEPHPCIEKYIRIDDFKKIMLFRHIVKWAVRKQRKQRDALIFCDTFHANFSYNYYLSPLLEYAADCREKFIFFAKDRFSEIHRELSSRNYRLASSEYLTLDYKSLIKAFRDMFRCLFYTATSAHGKTAFFFHFELFQILLVKYNMLAIIGTYDFRYYMPMMGDMNFKSSIITHIMNLHGRKTVSYCHTTYYFMEYNPLNIDYNFFGYSGHREFELYKQRWEKCGNIKLINSGPLTITRPSKNKNLQDFILSVKEPGKPLICVYPTSIWHYNHITPAHYRIFLKSCFELAAKLSISKLLFKDKYVLKRQRNDHIPDDVNTFLTDTISELIDEFDIQLFFIDDFISKQKKPVSSSDIHRIIDVGCTLGTSTASFELLSLRKKCVVYDPYGYREHSFKKHSPLLAADNANDFINNLEKVIIMDNAKYREYIAPTIQYCSKAYNESCFHDFFGEIDHELLPGETNA